MSEFDYIKFNKRYDKFKKNNLPTPFWDEERQTLEYVYFNDCDNNKLQVNSDLVDALADIAWTGFYYAYNSKLITLKKEDKKYIKKISFGHNHAHSFEDVVKDLYRFPESFKILKKDEKYYSEQELKYLKKVQKYLLFIGLKDVDDYKKISNKRYQNKLHKKYKNCMIYGFKNKIIKDILDEKYNFRVIPWYSAYKEREYKNGEYRVLLTDEEYNIKLYIEFNKEEVKSYKDIKKIYKSDEFKDNDKVIVCYFKILERY